MSNLSDIMVVSSEDETDSRLPSERANRCVTTPAVQANCEEEETISITSVGEVEQDESDPSDCEIVSVEDVRGEEKWRNLHDPFKMLNALLQAGYNNPRQLLGRLFGLDQKSLPTNQSEQWGLLLTLLAEPTPRRRLRHVNTLETVVGLLDSCRSILVVTGAGISVSCGIPDFRSRDGIYARLAKDYPDLSSPQAMFDMAYFMQNPSPFFKFAKEIFPGQFSPSLTHHFVALLESKDKLLRNYTQNIDTLEQMAGITRLIQCHGSFVTASCISCKFRVPGDDIKESVLSQSIPYCPRCRPSQAASGTTEQGLSATKPRAANGHSGAKRNGRRTLEPCHGVMKPDIVFFGEDLSSEFHDTLATDVHETDLVLVIGSSLKVRPVAHIPNSIPEHVPQVLINREPLSNHDFDVELLGDCDVIVHELCLRLGWNLPGASDTAARRLVPLSDLIEERSKGGLGQKMNVPNTEPNFTGERIQSENEKQPPQPLFTASSVTRESVNLHSSTNEITTTDCLHCVKSAQCAPRSVSSEKDVVEVGDSEDDSELNDLWDVAAFLPPNSFTRIPPNQYVFPGAELFVSQDEIQNSDLTSSGATTPSHNCDSPDHAALDADLIPMTVTQRHEVNQRLLHRLVQQSTNNVVQPYDLSNDCSIPVVGESPSENRVPLRETKMKSSPKSQTGDNRTTSIAHSEQSAMSTNTNELSTVADGPESKRPRTEPHQLKFVGASC
ncbi:hypothetical protein AHF37_02571 [Paragonimus kellicotti]|nr:hypothetical protein AHF37_02571 [Paragonimus kellicotti]